MTAGTAYDDFLYGVCTALTTPAPLLDSILLIETG